MTYSKRYKQRLRKQRINAIAHNVLFIAGMTVFGGALVISILENIRVGF
jgi:hypothetical protein